jgi:hypothetical protein
LVYEFYWAKSPMISGYVWWRMLILECSQGCYVVKIWLGDLDLWPWKSIGQTWYIFSP